MKDCPYWAVEHLCGLSGGCGVCECDENEIPLPWKLEDQTLTDKVSTTTPQNFQTWDDRAAHMWTVQDGKDASYVLLTASPEGNTGYRDGRNIWAIIYKENCFQGPLSEMCLEERVTYRLISGMHASTNTHLAWNYHKDPETGKWSSNATVFNFLVGKYPDRIGNIYFTFVFMLRAIHRLSSFLKSYDFNTGNKVEDAQVKEMVEQLLATPLLCQPTFDEAMLFKGHEKSDIVVQMKNYFRNISTLMDCVSCEKCKLWGKLQTMGLGTALKILSADSEEVNRDLQRNEIVAMINTLRQLSDSIHIIQEFQKAAAAAAAADLSSTSPSNSTPNSPPVAPLTQSHVIAFVGGLLAMFACLYVIRANNRRCESKQGAVVVGAKRSSSKKSQ